MATLPPGVDLSQIPLAPNPNGEPPNFINPPSNGDLVFDIGLPLLIVTPLFVFVRLVTAMRVVGRLYTDDYLCILATVWVFAYFGLGLTFRSTAKHVWDIPLSDIDASFFKRIFAFSVISAPAFWLCKAAIISLYLRIFSPKRWFRWSCYSVLTVTLLYWIVIPLDIAWCAPHIGESWDITTVGERCGKTSWTGVMNGAVSVAADIAIILLPLPIIFGLHLEIRRKVGLAIVFLVGAFALVASSISLYYRVRVFTSGDSTWDGEIVNACAIAETSVTIIVSCAPALSSFWVKIFTQTTFYSYLQSSLLRSTISSTASKNRNASTGNYERSFPAPESTSNLVHKKSSYLELTDLERGQLQTTIRTEARATNGHTPAANVITKSVTLGQRFDQRDS